MKPTTDDLVVLTAALAGVVLGTAAMGWAAWMLLRRGREIEAMADEYRTHDEIDSMQGEVKDQLHAAVRIARGTDPGKDTR